jgi:putative ABC transport system permease protein
MVPVQYNARSLFVRKVTTFATAFGIALVVVVFAGALMIGDVSRVLAAAGRPDTVIILRKGSDAELSSAIGNDYLGLFRGPPQVSQTGGAIGEIIVVVIADHIDGSGSSNVLVRGTPAEGIAFRPEIKLVSGRAPKPGTSEVMVGSGIAGRFHGLAIGGSLDLRRNRPLSVVGVFSADGASYESESGATSTTSATRSAAKRWCRRCASGSTARRTSTPTARPSRPTSGSA